MVSPHTVAKLSRRIEALELRRDAREADPVPTLIADGEGEDKVLARYLAAHPDEDRELIVFVIVDAEPPEIRPGSEESRRSGKPRWDYRRRREERTV